MSSKHPHRYMTPEDWQALRRALDPEASQRLDDIYRGQGVIVVPGGQGAGPSVRLPTERMTGFSEVHNDDQVFRIRMNVKHFRQEELSILIRDDERIVVHGTHTERPDAEDDESTISREFWRQYVLPKNVDLSRVTAQFSDDGILQIKVMKFPQQEDAERVIPISIVDPSVNT
ncbi:hypothetical protein BaRGS_00016696 [Batillaria attramentaria]|uniref:SHSP domain-containing protein n=1 Tax=Batillaria attramentaria TaxID=370345 RepID=A0ABD0KXT4_9CAEN